MEKPTSKSEGDKPPPYSASAPMSNQPTGTETRANINSSTTYPSSLAETE